MAPRGSDLRIMLFGVLAAVALAAGTRALPLDAPGLVPVATLDAARSCRRSIGGDPVLSLKGSWREMGRQQGVLVDADAAGAGGIPPEIRIPRTRESIAVYASGVDVELDFARVWLTR